MSRIYQSENSSGAKFQGSARGGNFQPVQASSEEKRMREYKESISRDANTKARELQREATAENVQTRAKHQTDRTQLQLETQAEAIELKMDQTIESDELKRNQLFEKGSLDLKAKQQSLAAGVQNAKTRAISTTVSSLLSFGGSALKYGQQMNKIQEEEKQKQDFIDSGAWAFTSDFDGTLGGASTIDEESNQIAVEGIEEQAVVDAAPGNPVAQESIRTAIGVDQTTGRQYSQISVGQAASEVNGRLIGAFYDPGTRITLPDGQTISPLQASSPQELSYVIRALAQGVTADMGVGSGDRYTAVKQYVPKLESAMRSLEAQMMPKVISATQNNRESTGFTVAGQTLQNTGDVQSAWSQAYNAAWYSGKYMGDKGKATKAAFEAFTATATRGQLEELKGVQVFEGGPTFGNDKRFSNQIDDAIDKIDSGVISDFNRQKGLQTIELSNATNSYTESLINAKTPEQTTQAHQAYEAELGRLSEAGNAQARKELIKQQGVLDNYNPNNANQLREQIAEGQTFSEEFLKSELASGRINPQEYSTLKQAGLATPENRAKAYGGKEAYSGLNSGVKAQMSKALEEQLGPIESDVRQGYISSMAQDVIKRRDAAVNAYIQQAPDASPGDVQAFAERWTQNNIPNLVANVELDKETGSLTGYVRMGQTTTPQPATAANGYKGLPTFSNPYTKKQGSDFSSISLTSLRNSKGSGVLTDFISNKVLTTNERTAAIKAYTSGGNYPPSVAGKAQALGILPDDLVKLQAAGAGYKLGEKPTQEVPPATPDWQRSSYETSANPNVVERRALNVIGKYESDSVGGYNAVNQGGANGGHTALGHSGDIRKMSQHNGKPLTDFSVGEIMSLQKEDGSSMDSWISRGRLHAVGRYQFIGPTFANVASQMGLPSDLKFTPDVQDAMALHLLRTAGNGINQWVGPASHASYEERQAVTAARVLRNPNATDAQLRRVRQSFGQ